MENPVDVYLTKQKEIQTHRNQNIDIVRIFAAFSVVCIHVHNDTTASEGLARFFLLFCVPFFYIASLTYFITGLNKSLSINKVILKIWKRIGVPFFIWSCIYIGLVLVKHKIAGNNINVNIVPVFLYGSSAEHMYYLPELIIMQAVALSVFLLVNDIKRPINLFIFVGALYYLAWGHWYNYFGVTTITQLITYVLMAFYLAPLMNHMNKRRENLAAGILLILLAVSGLFINYPTILATYLISLPIGGIGLFWVVLSLPKISLPSWVVTFSSATYGIYLSHILFLEAIELLIEKSDYKISYTVTTKLVVTLLVFFISLFFTLVVKKIPITRSLLLGENRH